MNLENYFEVFLGANWYYWYDIIPSYYMAGSLDTSVLTADTTLPVTHIIYIYIGQKNKVMYDSYANMDVFTELWRGSVAILDLDKNEIHIFFR